MKLLLLFLLTGPLSKSDPNTLSVIAYNIQMLPRAVKNTHQKKRVKSIVLQMQPYDLVVFSEAFDDGIRRSLIKQMKATFPYYTCILGHAERCEEGDQVICQDGGVIIFSKYPILAQDQRLFYKTTCEIPAWQLAFGKTRKQCWGSDCLARKGVLYAKVSKNGRIFHIFGSHLQASYDHNEKYRLVRERQFKIITTFIDQKSISANEPIVIAGDLNVDRLSAPDEYATMLQLLKAVDSPHIGIAYTYDPGNNCLAEPGAAEYLDYVLFRKDHRRPIQATVETKLLRNERPYRQHKHLCDALSDHYPVVSIAVFD